jgi:hypothetical protein
MREKCMNGFTNLFVLDAIALSKEKATQSAVLAMETNAMEKLANVVEVSSDGRNREGNGDQLFN